MQCGHTIAIVFRRVFIAFVILLSADLAARGAIQTTQSSGAVPRLIQSLSDPDSTVRRRASEQLLSAGAAARPDLIAIARSGDPEQRARAAEILRKLPWFTPGDSQHVRGLLSRYGLAQDEGRMAILGQVNGQPGSTAVLLRIFGEEPSDAVRWAIVVLLLQKDDANTTAQLRAITPADDDPPALMLVGGAWLQKDRLRGLDYFRRAIDADQVKPTGDRGVLTFAFDELIKTAITDCQFDQAADLLRQQIPRDTRFADMQEDASDSAIPSLAKLAALHRYFGPLRGAAGDEQLWGGRSPAASLSTAISSLLTRLGAPPPLPVAQAFDLSAEDRQAAGAFLMSRGFVTAGELEFRTALAAPKKGNAAISDFRIMYVLGRTLAQAGQDEQAANWLDRAMQLKTQAGLQFRGSPVDENGWAGPRWRRELAVLTDDDVTSEIHWRRARAAQTAGNVAAADENVKKLVGTTPTTSDNTISIIQWLRDTGRGEQAKALFNRVYERARVGVDTSSDRRKAGLQNDLAWMCARSGERLDDAVTLGRAALAAQPDTAAFMDTLAEALYRHGEHEEAIQLETKAIELTPDNDFMRGQLERFKAGKP